MKKFLFMLLLTHAACAMEQNMEKGFNPYESGSGTRIENLRQRLMKSQNLNLNDSIEIKQHYQSFQNMSQGAYNWDKYFQGSQYFQNLTGLTTDLLVYKNFKLDKDLLNLLNNARSSLSNMAEVIKKNEEEARERGRLALQQWENESQQIQDQESLEILSKKSSISNQSNSKDSLNVIDAQFEEAQEISPKNVSQNILSNKSFSNSQQSDKSSFNQSADNTQNLLKKSQSMPTLVFHQPQFLEQQQLQHVTVSFGDDPLNQITTQQQVQLKQKVAELIQNKNFGYGIMLNLMKEGKTSKIIPLDVFVQGENWKQLFYKVSNNNAHVDKESINKSIKEKLTECGVSEEKAKEVQDKIAEIKKTLENVTFNINELGLDVKYIQVSLDEKSHIKDTILKSQVTDLLQHIITELKKK